MPRVKYFYKVNRTQFKKLPKGGVYYLDGAGTGPFVKLGDRKTLIANTYPVSSAGTAVADVSVAVKRVGRRVLGQSILR